MRLFGRELNLSLGLAFAGVVGALGNAMRDVVSFQPPTIAPELEPLSARFEKWRRFKMPSWLKSWPRSGKRQHLAFKREKLEQRMSRCKIGNREARRQFVRRAQFAS